MQLLSQVIHPHLHKWSFPVRQVWVLFNPIQFIFRDVTNYLEELNLSSTGLKVLHWASFNNLHRLRVLNLSRNELFAIPLGLFETLSSLHSLDMSHNLIGFLQAETLKGLNSLLQINIMDNKLSHIDDKCFVDVRHLTSLTLNSNFLTKINESTFFGLENLERLEIENNKIRQIQDGSFLVLPSLQYLSMSNNYITNITKKTLQGLSHLSELILEDNKIDNISDSSFISIQHLKQLHLENNKLVTLGSGGRPPLGLEGLDVLNLEDNPVNCSCELSWIQHIPAYTDHVTGSCSHPDGNVGYHIDQIDFSMCKLNDVQLDASTKEKENQITGGGNAINDVRLAS